MFSSILKLISSFRYIKFLFIACIYSAVTLAAVVEQPKDSGTEADNLIEIVGYYRHRPPDMVVDGDNFSGPLIDLIEVACKNVGYKIKWSFKPWGDSLQAIRDGEVDIVPRAFKVDRRDYVRYVGPIGYQWKEVSFLLLKGKEDIIHKISDLEGLKVGVRDGTAYTDEFDNDDKIIKVAGKVDKDVLKLLLDNKVNAVIVLDRQAMDEVIAEMGLQDKVEYSKHKQQQRRDIYYAGSKARDNEQMYKAIDLELKKMIERMEISLIYAKYNLYPPQRRRVN